MLDGMALIADRLHVKLRSLFAVLRDCPMGTLSLPAAITEDLVYGHTIGGLQRRPTQDRSGVEKRKSEYARKIFGCDPSHDEVSIQLSEQPGTQETPAAEVRGRAVLPLRFVHRNQDLVVSSQGLPRVGQPSVEGIQRNDDTSPFISSLEQSKSRALNQFIEACCVPDDNKNFDNAAAAGEIAPQSMEQALNSLSAILLRKLGERFSCFLIATSEDTNIAELAAANLLRRTLARKVGESFRALVQGVKTCNFAGTRQLAAAILMRQALETKAASLCSPVLCGGYTIKHMLECEGRLAAREVTRVLRGRIIRCYRQIVEFARAAAAEGEEKTQEQMKSRERGAKPNKVQRAGRKLLQQIRAANTVRRVICRKLAERFRDGLKRNGKRVEKTGVAGA